MIPGAAHSQRHYARDPFHLGKPLDKRLPRELRDCQNPVGAPFAEHVLESLPPLPCKALFEKIRLVDREIVDRHNFFKSALLWNPTIGSVIESESMQVESRYHRQPWPRKDSSRQQRLQVRPSSRPSRPP